MLRFGFPLVAALLMQPICAFSLDTDRDQPAFIDAPEIEIDFATGRRIYRGGVTIEQGSLRITADEIELFFNEDELERAVAHGQPAIFRQQPEGSEHQIIGQARQIEINEIEDIATFTGDACLRQHLDTITGGIIIYHMQTQKMTVRGSDNTHSRTTRMSETSVAECIAQVIGDQNTRPRVVIQPEENLTPKTASSSPQPLEPSVLSIADGVILTAKTEPTNTPATAMTNAKSSVTNVFTAARVSTAGTGVYSSYNSDAMVLGGLSGGVPVKVLEIHEEWAWVEIPSGLSVWVFGTYAIEGEGSEALINGQGVRARWLPAHDSRIVGIFHPGDRVRVLATQGSWKQVSLPPSIPAWVPTRQLEILESISPEWWNEWAAHAGRLPGGGD